MSTDFLAAALGQALTSAQTAFTISNESADIKQSTDALRALLHEWQTHHDRVETLVRGLLEIVQARCKHDGAKRGHNERDGSWMNPCPTCGASE